MVIILLHGHLKLSLLLIRSDFIDITPLSISFIICHDFHHGHLLGLPIINQAFLDRIVH